MRSKSWGPVTPRIYFGLPKSVWRQEVVAIGYFFWLLINLLNQ